MIDAALYLETVTPQAMVPGHKFLIDEHCQCVFAGLSTVQRHEVLHRLPHVGFAALEKKVPTFRAI